MNATITIHGFTVELTRGPLFDQHSTVFTAGPITETNQDLIRANWSNVGRQYEAQLVVERDLPDYDAEERIAGEVRKYIELLGAATERRL